MGAITRLLGIALPVLLLPMLLLAAAPAAVAAPSISGFVLADADGSALEGAEVSLLAYLDGAELAERFAEPAQRLAETRTDADGFYRIDAPEAGFYLLLVEARGMRPMVRGLEPLLDSETLPTLRLAEAIPASIRVAGAGGSVIEGARVLVTAQPEWDRQSRMRIRRRARSGWLPYRQRALTGEDGLAKLVVGPQEKLALAVAAAGTAPLELELSSGDIDGVIDVSLGAGQARRLRLVDEAGRGLADVLVRHGRHLPIARSDADGRLAVHVGEAPLRLVAEAGERHGQLAVPRSEVEESEVEESEVEESEVEESEDEQPAELELRLEAPERIGGQVLDVSRRPIAGALVWTGRRPDTATRTDNRGAYDVPHTASAGKQWLAAAAAGFRRGQASVGAAAVEAPTLILEPAASLAGRVLDQAGEPVAGAEIEVHELAEQRRYRPRGQAVSTPDGRFHVAGLQVERAFELKARARGYTTRQLSLEPLELGEARAGLEIRLAPALVAVGRVVDEQERPVAGARVDMAPQPKSADFRAIFRQMRERREPNAATTGEQGRFRIEDLDPATYRLTATAAGYAPVRVPGLELAEGAGEVDLGTVVVVPGVELVGRVLDPGGKALADAEVLASPKAGSMAAMMANVGVEPQSARTGEDGRFVFEDLLPEQALEIALEKEGWAAEPADVTTGAESKTVDLVMQPAATLVVEVRDTAGQAVPQAIVVAKKSGVHVGVGPFRSESAASGRGEIEDLVPGRYDVEVTAGGFRPSSRAGVEVTPGTEPIEVVLDRGLRIEGTVYDSSGAPVSGAVVRHQPSSRAIVYGRRAGRSDGDGRFELEGLDAGPQEIRVFHQEHGEVSKRIEVAEGLAPVEIRYSGGAAVSGVVLDVATGEGVGGASVQLRADGQMRGPFIGRGSLSADTGTDGSFTIANVPGGSYTPAASHPDYAIALGEAFEVGQAAVSGVVLEMGGGETIVGRVLGVEFDQLAGTSVVAVSPKGGLVAATLDYEGRFRLERLAPGDWVLQASSADGRQASERVQLGAGDGEVEVEIEFGGGLTVRGTVMRGGSPLSGVDVRASHREQFTVRQGRTDLEGRFEIQGLEPGTYSVHLQRFRGEILRQEQITLEGDDEWFFDLQAASVAGRVTGAGGAAIPGALLKLWPAAAGEAQNGVGFSTGEVVSDSLGAFDFGEVGAGSYRLIASKPGYAQGERPLEIASAPHRDLEIVLERSAGVSLRLQRAAGGRPAQVAFTVLDAADQLVESGSRPVGDDGLLHLDSLPAGDFTLLLAEPGGPSVGTAIRSPGDAGAVTLPQGGVLRIDVSELFAEGTRADIKVRRADGRLYRAVEDFGRWASWLRGSEHRRALPAGSFTVEIEASDSRRWQFPITVVAGGETTLRVP